LLSDPRALRPPKAAVDPRRPLGWLAERERLADGRVVPSLTVFLAGRECPWSCVFCDLWRHTLDRPTPDGALPRQLELALEAAGPPPAGAQIKLYNASNFFDPKAVPPADEEAIAGLVAPFAQVVVECHPKLVGRRAFAFAERLAGRLQVAMGLETIHPAALPRLGKGMSRSDFARAAGALRRRGLGSRAFVLVGAPYVPPAETVDWAVYSAAFAFDAGVEHVALIPVRGGNGALEALAARGDFTPPSLAQLEDALGRCLELAGGAVTADLWDLDRLADCPACFGRRRERLERLNLSGRNEPRVSCEHCA